MPFIADLHIHSKYSRATSKDMGVETLSRWAQKKGITLLGTGDFTHPDYLAELKTQLEPDGTGLFRTKQGTASTRFMLTAEVSNIFSQHGRLRKIHTLIFAPGFEVVEKINAHLAKRGKLRADGRPIFGFPVQDLVKLVLDISADCLLVPAHAWTPWFSLFGAKSGFDSIEECFRDEARHIYAIETGLSSDPAMNWRLSSLDKITLISNSDAHSPAKIGREANVFDCSLSYAAVIDTIKQKDHQRLLYTIEFFPEEGKYHYDGHRLCDILFSPAQTRNNKGICPVCRRPLTVGVLHRVEELADRPSGFIPPQAIPAKHLIPLVEIIAEALKRGVNTKSVQNEYQKLIDAGGSEFNILLHLSLQELASFIPDNILERIERMRQGNLQITPGYDGVYGKINILSTAEPKSAPPQKPRQLNLFF
jgi:uncharacterized protein (TIGR00375 family)